MCTHTSTTVKDHLVNLLFLLTSTLLGSMNLAASWVEWMACRADVIWMMYCHRTDSVTGMGGPCKPSLSSALKWWARSVSAPA